MKKFKEKNKLEEKRNNQMRMGIKERKEKFYGKKREF